MNFIDLFAGAGGMSLGFENAGFKLKLALELDKSAFGTYTYNRNELEFIKLNTDISILDYKQIEKLGITSEIDVLVGGPPCQGYSSANPKKMADDKRNNLYEYFIKWVDIFRPKFFVMENVKGIQNSFAGGQKYSDLIKSEFEKIGYSTELFELNSENFGVPQKRIRIFFIGSRTTENFEISNYSLFNRPQNIWDAISDLSFLEPKEGNESQSYVLPVSSDYQGWARKNSDVLFNHQSMNHTERMIERYKALQNGTWFEDLPSHLRVKKRNGGGILSSSRFRLNYRILEKDKQSFTIPASFYSSFIHPTQPRNITAREAARIQSYPDNYVFRGKRTEISSSLLKRLGKEFSLSQYNQIGNSVPPLLAYGIALNLKKYLLK